MTKMGKKTANRCNYTYPHVNNPKFYLEEKHLNLSRYLKIRNLGLINVIKYIFPIFKVRPVDSYFIINASGVILIFK